LPAHWDPDHGGHVGGGGFPGVKGVRKDLRPPPLGAHACAAPTKNRARRRSKEWEERDQEGGWALGEAGHRRWDR
jgi:hypothetical protein